MVRLLEPDAAPDPVCLVGRWEPTEALAKLADLNSQSLVDSRAWWAATSRRSEFVWLRHNLNVPNNLILFGYRHLIVPNTFRELSPARLRAVLIELQSHSTVSDGQLRPSEVVEKAAEAGVTTLALTDHDAIAGVPEAAEAAEQLGIELVPAIEMSCVHRYAEDLHVCGYWVDLEKIAPACDRAQQERRAGPGRSCRTCGGRDST